MLWCGRRPGITKPCRAARARSACPEKVRKEFPRIQHVWADAGASGEIGPGSQAVFGAGRWRSSIIPGRQRVDLRTDRPPPPSEVPEHSVVLKRQWVFEHPSAWLGQSRRMSRDLRVLPETFDNLVYELMSA